MRKRNQSASCSPRGLPIPPCKSNGNKGGSLESSPFPCPLSPLPHPRKSKVPRLGRRLASQKYRTTGLVDKDKEEGRNFFERTKKPPLRKLTPSSLCRIKCPRAPCNHRQIASQDTKKNPKDIFIVRLGKLGLK